ncbi:serine/threonine-protein phosphatase [Streptomyces thinghirensis]|nr:serine/threonine-protein phosphatase [Streptomyces thinghirensis]
MATPRFSDFATVDLALSVFRGTSRVSRTARSYRCGVPPSPACATTTRCTPGAVTGTVPTSLGSLGDDERHSPARRGRGDRTRPVRGRSRHTPNGSSSTASTASWPSPCTHGASSSGLANFWRSENPAPFDADDEVFAQGTAARAAGVRRQRPVATPATRTAVTLQRSLLPSGLPEQDALDIAHRYVPAEAGGGRRLVRRDRAAGGRVALVVGDVVGHGCMPPPPWDGCVPPCRTSPLSTCRPTNSSHAWTNWSPGSTRRAARTAPRSPGRPASRDLRPGGGPVFPEPGGTSQPRAGAAGRVRALPGQPRRAALGVGSGLPFEAVELDLPAGSRLVLYTDGLVETRGRDIDEGMELLRRSLARAGRTPERPGDVLATLPSRPSDDDVALLVAGTRVLDPSRVSASGRGAGPGRRLRIRREVTDRLAEWGLDEEAFVTELILSELLINAVRYGTDPVRVRLLHDRTLIC